jgi:hypothetical protein
MDCYTKTSVFWNSRLLMKIRQTHSTWSLNSASALLQFNELFSFVFSLNSDAKGLTKGSCYRRISSTPISIKAVVSADKKALFVSHDFTRKTVPIARYLDLP